MKKARANAKLNIVTVAGYQEYIELAIIDALDYLVMRLYRIALSN